MDGRGVGTDDNDEVEAKGPPVKAMFATVPCGGGADSAALASPEEMTRESGVRGPPRFHFDEDKDIAVKGDEIDFAPGTTKAAFKNRQARPVKKPTGEVLTGEADGVRIFGSGEQWVEAVRDPADDRPDDAGPRYRQR